MKNPPELEEVPVPDRSNAPLSAWERGEIPPVSSGPGWVHHRLKQFVRFGDVYTERCAGERPGNRCLHRKVGRSAVGNGAGAVSGVDVEELLTAFRDFLDHVQEQQAAERPGPNPRIRPVRTPRSEAPLASAQPAELLRPEYARGRLYFSCPCCHFPAVLPKWLSGKKARCPRCYSAIRAPHPRRGWKARILENDIESLLHPERFSDYRNAHRLIPWVGLPRPKLEPSLQTAGVVILLTLLCVFAPLVLNYAHSTRMAAVRLAAEGTASAGGDLKERARRVVEQFFAAKTLPAKAALVRDSDRVAPLMTDWYRRHPDLLEQEPAGIEASGARFYSSELVHPVTEVWVTTRGRTDQKFTVEHLPAGDRIEWESSVGYNTDLTDLFSGTPERQSQVVRVVACLDDYYNFEYHDPGEHICVRLHAPDSLELLGYGYVPMNRADAALIASELNGSGPGALRPMMVEVRPVERTARTRQLEIVRMLESSWRTKPTEQTDGLGAG